MTDVFDTHAEFERHHPDWAAAERLAANQRKERGMPALRQFPCPGVLTVIDRYETSVDVACSACPAQFSVRTSAATTTGDW